MDNRNNNKKYVMIITSEDERYDPDRSHGGVQLDFFADKPWEGRFECLIYGDDFEDLKEAMIWNDVEGLFYQFYENKNGNRISYGSVDFDRIEEEIEEYESGEDWIEYYEYNEKSK